MKITIFSKYTLVLLIIVIFNILIRLSSLNTPIYDRHNFRQSDTYAMIILLHEGKSNLFYPKFYQAPDKENINHYYLAEFPIYQKLTALFFDLFGENLYLARIINVIIFSFGGFGIFLIASHFFNEKYGILSVLVFSTFPSTFFWARSITPDILALSTLILSTALILRFTKKKSNFFLDVNSLFIYSSLLISISILIKPFYFAFLPFHFVILWLKNKDQTFRKYLYYFLTPILFFLLWRLWLNSFPKTALSDPNFHTLMNLQTNHFFYLMNSSWIPNFITNEFLGQLLTPLGGLLVLFGIGVLLNEKKREKKIVLFAWIISSSIVTLTIAYGSSIHDYYNLHWTPISALLVTYLLTNIITKLKTNFRIMLVAFVSVFIIYYLWFLPFQEFTKSYFSNTAYYSERLVEDYKKISELIPEDQTVVTIQPFRDPYIINQVRRFGYTIGYKETLCNIDNNPYNELKFYSDKEVNYAIAFFFENDLIECKRNHEDFFTLVEKRLIFSGNNLIVFRL